MSAFFKVHLRVWKADTMDTLIAERRRIADAYRAKLASLTALRAQLADARTDEARQSLYAAVDEEAARCRELGDKLLQFDAKVAEMQFQEAATRTSPLLWAPDF